MADKNTTKRSRARKPAANAGPSFPEALAKLLRARKLPVPDGLAKAPAEAYAHQPASFVEELAKLDDPALRLQADRIAGYAGRQAQRAENEWERSPLIAEIRRRKLKEPKRPSRVVGVSPTLKRPLQEWSDSELLELASEWSRRGRS